MQADSAFLQGIFSFHGGGLTQPSPLIDGGLFYTVPGGKYGQPTYFRAGNSSDALICVTLLREGVPMRYFPIGAKSDTHVALAVIEDLAPGTRIELQIAAPSGVEGTVIIDLGMVLTNYDY